MRLAIVASLAVVVAGLGSQPGVGLPLSNSGLELIASSEPRQVVFVDKAELAKLHPSWQALSDMRAVLDRAGGKQSAKVGSSRPSRTELAARAAVKANKALDELKARKHEALKVRSDAMKAQKMQSAELDWKADVRAIEQSAAAQTKSVDARNSADLLNARLKSMAAGAAAKVAGKEGSGLDAAVADDVLKNTQERLNAVQGADELEKKAIADSAAEKIDSLKQASVRRVDSEVRAFEIEQSKLIGEGIATAKREIARQMGPDAMIVAQARLAEDTIAESSGESSAVVGMARLRKAVEALQARIQQDVDSAVRYFAASKGMAVVFQRRKSAPDMTRTFADFIRKRGWNAYSPDKGEVGSS